MRGVSRASHRDVQTYLKERIREVLTGAQRPRSWCGSTATTCRTLRDNAEEINEIFWRHRRRRSTSTSRCRSTCRSSRSRWTSRPRSSTASSPVTCVAPRRRWSRARRSATSIRGGKAYDVQVWSTPEARSDVTSIREPADRHARRARSSALGDVADVSLAADAEHHRARRQLPPHRHRAPTSKRRELGSVVADDGGGPARDRSSRGLPRRDPRRVRGARRRRPDRLLLLAVAAVARDLPAAAGGLRQLATGDARRSSRCPWRSSAACSRPSSPAAVSSRSARSSGFLTDHRASPPATASCSSTTASTSNGTKVRRSAGSS